MNQTHLQRTFSAFRYRDFRLVWIGAVISTTGTWMQTVAQAWIVFSLTKSAFLLGFDAFLSTLPMILFSLIGGVVADRVDRKKMLLLSQFLQMISALTLAALIATEVVQVWHIFVLSFFTGTAQSFGGPAYQALLPTLVKNREDVPNAIAMNSLQFNLARIIGPVFAGIALERWGPSLCFLLNALSFVAVMVTLLMVRARFDPPPATTSSVLEQIREGFRFVADRTALMQLCFLGFASTFLGIPILTLLPVVAKSIFSLDASGYGRLLAASGVGSVVGALFIASVGHSKQKGRIALFFQLTFAIFLALFAFSTNLWLSTALIFVTGASLLGVITMTSSLVQLATDEGIRGRVTSIFLLAFRGGMPLGNIVAGFVADQWSVRIALTVNALVLGAIAITFLVKRTAMEKL